MPRDASMTAADMRCTSGAAVMSSAHGMVVQRSAVAGVTLVWAQTAHRFGRHTHDEFGMGVMEAGAQRSASGRGPVLAAAGDVITVNPDEVHDGLPVGASERRWRMLYLRPECMQRALAAMPLGVQELSHPVRRCAQAKADVLSLMQVAASPLSAAAPHWEERLLRVLSHLTDDVRLQTPELPSDAVQKVRHHIDREPADATPLSALASMAGLSRFELVRAFTRHVGLPPHAYRVQRRTQLARQLILAGMPLVDAAITAGFSDQSHMTRTLARAYGFRPAALARAAGR